MPVAFSDIFDDIEARLAALYPSHKRLADPYQLDANSEQSLVKGWGIGITPAVENTFRFLSNERSARVNLVISFTRSYMATEHNVSTKIGADKLLIADFETLIDDIWTNDLGIDQTLNYGLSEVTTADGIVPVFADRQAYRALICNVNVEYFRKD